MTPFTTRIDRLAVRPDSEAVEPDELATEEPLEIRAEGPGQAPVPISVTMRTPGHDLELAAGFLFTEGLLKSADDLADGPMRERPVLGRPDSRVTLRLRASFDAERLKRNFYATSSCGLCGKASIDHIAVAAGELAPGPTVARSTLVRLPAELRAAQQAFAATGGLHATGVFSASGQRLVVREDVGRHNAFDKVVGRLLLDRALPASNRVAVVSGRLSFEIVQKAAMAGLPILCAVSAPSSLAVQAAHKLGMTLVGFLRGERFNVYTRQERVDRAR